MKRGLTPLLLILLIQSALVGVLYWPGETPGFARPPPMAAFDRQQIDTIFVGDEFDNETVLTRVGDRWSLPEMEHLPADTEMVDKLLDTLVGDDGSWPVAQTAAARQRFRVATYHYRRRIALLGEGDILATILLGTSPGFRKIYARNEKQNGIYSIVLSTQDVPGLDGGWLDRTLVQIRTPLRINADAYSLQREGTEWVSGIGRTPDPRELSVLLDTLRNIQIDGLASGDMQRDLAVAEAELILQVESLAGEVTLELFELEDKHYIHSSEYPLFFTLSAYDYNRLTNIDYRLISGEDYTESLTSEERMP